jgi:hypothetical protein
VVATQRPPRSALGNHPLTPIQESLLHLLAGLLDLLEPDFASSRGARRESPAHALTGPRGRTGPGEWERALPPSQAHTLASTPIAADPARWQAPEGPGAAGSGVHKGADFWHRLLAVEAACDSRGGLGSP